MRGDRARESLAGKKIASVSGGNKNEDLMIACEDGSLFAAHVEGDCCSHSWIEHLTVPDDIQGAEILGITDSDTTLPDGIDMSQYDCLQAYETRIRTTRGDIVMEYRNDSNGYYGGYSVFSQRA
jgi:hypothetical protein